MINKLKKIFQHTSALDSRWRTEGSPELLGADFTTGWHVEADGDKLVTLEHDGHDLVPVRVSQYRRGGVVVRLPGLSFSCVKHLEYPGNLLGVSSDHVALGH